MINLNYISSYRLNKMYSSTKTCLNCLEDEEGPAHAILFCNIGKQVYDYFDALLRRLSNRSLNLKEKCFGILLENKKMRRKID